MNLDDSGSKLDDFCAQLPAPVAVELLEELPADLRLAPGVRVDVGQLVDAIQIGVDGVGDISTIIVAGVGVRRFTQRLVKALRARGQSQVTIREPRSEGRVVDASEVELLAELLRRLQVPEDSGGKDTGAGSSCVGDPSAPGGSSRGRSSGPDEVGTPNG